MIQKMKHFLILSCIYQHTQILQVVITCCNLIKMQQLSYTNLTVPLSKKPGMKLTENTLE